MSKNEMMNKMLHQLCELKLEQRRVSNDIHNLVVKNNTIDFAKAKQLSNMRSTVKKQIQSIETRISPNIIA